MQSIDELAASAGYAISDLMGDDDWEKFDKLTSLEQVQYRYLHADCDDVAAILNRLTGWEIRAVNSVQGPLHRLVSAPDGRLADITGWTTLENIAKLYGAHRLHISEPGSTNVYHQSMLDDDEDFLEVINALLLIPEEPFTTELRGRLQSFGASIGLEIESAAKNMRRPE